MKLLASLFNNGANVSTVAIEATELADLRGQVAAIGKSQAVIEFALDGTVLYANTNFLNVLGYSLDEIKGKHHSMFVEPAYRQSMEYRMFWDRLARGDYDAGQYKRIAKNGKEVWVQASYNPIMDSNNRPFKVVKYATDITTEKLKDADYSGQLAAIGKSQAVIEFGLDGVIQNANQNFLSVLGYSLDEVKGKHHSMFVDPAYRQSTEYRVFWERLGRGEYDSGQYKRVGKNGKDVWVQASYNPIMDSDNRPFKVVKYATDITADKLRNADYSGQLAAISKSQAIIEFGMDGIVLNANDNFLNVLGYSLADIKGKHHSMFVDPTYRQSIEYRMFWERLGRGEYDTGQYKRIGKDAKEVWIQASYNPIVDTDNKPFKVVKYATDVTAQVNEARENTRIRQALDSSSANVMLADNSRNIIYMNKAVEAMLHIVESDFRKVLPHFSVDKIIGSNMDIFHKNPAHQMKLLENLTSTYVGNIAVGGRHMRLTANPIFTHDGTRLGSVVEWLDRTQEISVEIEVSDVVKAAGAGNFKARIPAEGKTGFFLSLAEGLNSLMQTADVSLGEVNRVLGAIAKGDLTERITTEYAGTFGDLKNYCNQTTESLTEMMTEIRTSAETIFTASSEIAEGNADLSGRTEQQAANLEETASSMEELTSTVKLNADNAKQANVLAEQASNVAIDGGVLIQEVVTTMSAINESSQKISDIIGVIDGIAFQTNILALNAAVEAARAGDQGRGFAVVASEVRTLAQRSANAAKDIKGLISDSVKKIESGNTLVNKSGNTMKEIVTAIKRVNDIMAEIAAASNEQSVGIEQISTAVSQMDEMTQQNAALVEEAAAAAESLQSQADQLTQRVAMFRLSNEQEDVHLTKSPARLSSARAPAKPAARIAAKSAASPKKKLVPPKQQDDEWESF